MAENERTEYSNSEVLEWAEYIASSGKGYVECSEHFGVPKKYIAFNIATRLEKLDSGLYERVMSVVLHGRVIGDTGHKYTYKQIVSLANQFLDAKVPLVEFAEQVDISKDTLLYLFKERLPATDNDLAKKVLVRFRENQRGKFKRAYSDSEIITWAKAFLNPGYSLKDIAEIFGVDAANSTSVIGRAFDSRLPDLDFLLYVKVKDKLRETVIGKRRFSDEFVFKIGEAIENGVSQAQLRREYNLDTHSMTRICHGTYPYLKYKKILAEGGTPDIDALRYHPDTEATELAPRSKFSDDDVIKFANYYLRDDCVSLDMCALNFGISFGASLSRLFKDRLPKLDRELYDRVSQKAESHTTKRGTVQKEPSGEVGSWDKLSKAFDAWIAEPVKLEDSGVKEAEATDTPEETIAPKAQEPSNEKVALARRIANFFINNKCEYSSAATFFKLSVPILRSFLFEDLLPEDPNLFIESQIARCKGSRGMRFFGEAVIAMALYAIKTGSPFTVVAETFGTNSVTVNNLIHGVLPQIAPRLAKELNQRRSLSHRKPFNDSEFETYFGTVLTILIPKRLADVEIPISSEIDTSAVSVEAEPKEAASPVIESDRVIDTTVESFKEKLNAVAGGTDSKKESKSETQPASVSQKEIPVKEDTKPKEDIKTESEPTSAETESRGTSIADSIPDVITKDNRLAFIRALESLRFSGADWIEGMLQLTQKYQSVQWEGAVCDTRVLDKRNAPEIAHFFLATQITSLCLASWLHSDIISLNTVVHEFTSPAITNMYKRMCSDREDAVQVDLDCRYVNNPSFWVSMRELRDFTKKAVEFFEGEPTKFIPLPDKDTFERIGRYISKADPSLYAEFMSYKPQLTDRGIISEKGLKQVELIERGCSADTSKRRDLAKSGSIKDMFTFFVYSNISIPNFIELFHIEPDSFEIALFEELYLREPKLFSLVYRVYIERVDKSQDELDGRGTPFKDSNEALLRKVRKLMVSDYERFIPAHLKGKI